MSERNPGREGFYREPRPPSSQRSVPQHFRSSLITYSNAERRFQHRTCPTKLFPSATATPSVMGASAATAQYKNAQRPQPPPPRKTYFHNVFAQTLPNTATDAREPLQPKPRNNPEQVFEILLRNPDCSALMTTKVQPNQHYAQNSTVLFESSGDQRVLRQPSVWAGPHGPTIQVSVSISRNQGTDNDAVVSDRRWNDDETLSGHHFNYTNHPTSHDETDFQCHRKRNPKPYQNCDNTGSMVKRTELHHRPECSSSLSSASSGDSSYSATDNKQYATSYQKSFASSVKGKNANEKPCYFHENATSSSDTENILFARADQLQNEEHSTEHSNTSFPNIKKKNRNNKCSHWSNTRADSLTCCDTASNLEFKNKWLLQRRSLDNQLFTRNVSEDMYPFITKETTFEVWLQKDSRGLGLSVCGGWNANAPHPNTHLIRIKRLFPLQTAMNCGKLNVGDIILSVNGRKLTGLTYMEAIEVLRMAPSDVVLVICRPEEGILPTLPENPKFFFSQESLKVPVPQYMELDVPLTKIGGTLGFTITKMEDVNPGHYIKSLVKDPALSDGNLHPGDKIVLVNGTDISDMSHEEAIEFLRSLPDEVNLCLWRNIAPASSQLSPLSPLSPESQNPFFDDNVKVKKPKPLLRKEALDMLSDKARQKNEKKINAALLTPSSPIAFNSPERKNENTPTGKERNSTSKSTRLSRDISNATDLLLRSPTSSGIASMFSVQTTAHDSFSTDSSGVGMEIKHDEAEAEESKVDPDEDDSNLNLNRKLQRPSFLDLASENHLSPRKQLYGMNFSHDPENDSTCDTSDISYKCLDSSCTESVPGSDEGHANVTFSESSPVLFPKESALLKWRGATLPEEMPHLAPPRSAQQFQRPSTYKVELERKWNSRLGFSLAEFSGTETAGIYIKLIYPGSLAAMDGRLQVGDKILEVNGTSVADATVDDTINMLRKSQGKILLTMERLPDNLVPDLAESPSSGGGDMEMHRSQSQHDNFRNISDMNARNNNISQFHKSSTPLTGPYFNKNQQPYTNLHMFS